MKKYTFKQNAKYLFELFIYSWACTWWFFMMLDFFNATGGIKNIWISLGALFVKIILWSIWFVVLAVTSGIILSHFHYFNKYSNTEKGEYDSDTFKKRSSDV